MNSPQRLEFVCRINQAVANEIIRSLTAILTERGDQGAVSIYGKKLKAGGLASELSKFDGKPVNIESETFKFHLAFVRNFHHILFQIESKFSPDKNWWVCWVDTFIHIDGFVQAWLVDVTYDFWENASDPLECSANGRSCKGQPLKSNGLPPPLESDIVDTSRNPGARILRDGFVEAVGARMWFSEEFLRCIGKDERWLAEQFWKSFKKLCGGLFSLVSSSKIFSDRST
jgi:hypothetical protein